MQEIIVNSNEAGQRLDKLLIKYLEKAPKSFIYKMLRKKNIKLNDKKAEGNEKLLVGDNIKIFLSDETIATFSAPKKKIEVSNLPKYKLDILYKDNDILIINKPVGMLSQKTEKNDISINDYVLEYTLKQKILSNDDMKSFKPSICNRLDRNTSGIIIAGISLKGLQEMSKLLKSRNIKKEYYCIVRGKIDKKQNISCYLNKDNKNNKVYLLEEKTEDNVYIQTEYKPILVSNDYTMLKVHLITGRSHQIRAHLALIGHAVIGDYKYGSKRVNDYFKKTYGLEAQLLHSAELTFPKDTNLSNLSEKKIVAPLPQKFEQIKNALFSNGE